jgi:4-amino-4-deoxy-L-arabinose transferase-like glycosyltransferase
MNKKSKKKKISNKIIFVVIPILLFIASLTISLILLSEYKNHPLFYHLNRVTDSVGFLSVAEQLAETNFIGSGKFNQEPGYQYFLSIIIKLFGNDLFTIKLFQSIVGSLTILLVYFLTLNIFNNFPAALFSSLLLLFCGIHYYYNLIILRPFLIPFLSFLSVLFFIFFLKTGKKKFIILSGFFTALAFFTRPTAISFIISALIILCFFSKKNIIYYLSGFGIVLILLIARNIKAEADLLSFSTKGPLEFASGNILQSTGTGWTEHPEASEYANKYKGLTSVMFNVVKDALLTDPIKYIGIKINKSIATIHNYEFPNNYSYLYYKEYRIPKLKYLIINAGIIFIFFTMGIVEIRFNKNFNYRTKVILLYLIMIFFYFLTIVAFYVISRFRFPFLVMMTPIAGFGISKLIFNIRKKNYKRLFIQIGCGLAALYLTFFYPVKGINKNFNMAMAYANDGSIFSELNMVPEAIERYEKALSYYSPEIGLTTIVKLFIRNNDFENALKYSVSGLKLYPNSVELTYLAAYNNIALKNYADSIEYLKKLSDNSIYQNYKYYNLALGYYHLNDYNNSLEYWKKYYKVNPADTTAAKNIEILSQWQNNQK